ncbi:LUC7 N terminus [Phytophthora infestans]|uniref:LUC7 N terminus n=1 Tax=Phytophthora infestans TaxID=4787 RepID=A0A833WVA9_PHYIN|nr:LUC7 N terminus [Phytophthora infestans]KAF4143572.1 LUC7 N terminus [Phytophthora infestans]
MDAQRALLDSLMGLNRDGDRPDDDASMDFRHPKVCKPYLCGLCPRDLFQNTRLDLGTCKSLHLPTLRSAYVEQKSTRDFGYERELINELSKLLADVEKKIARAQRRLDEDGEDNQNRMQILQLTQDMQDAAVQAEKAAKEGDADGSLSIMEKVEILKRKRRELLTQSTAGATNGVDNVNQKLRVCDVCGAFLSIFDSERRLADHFGGKVHVGYVQIRRKLKELMEMENEKKKEEEKQEKEAKRRRGDRPRSRREEEHGREDQERRRERSRSRSRNRRRSRDRYRERRSSHHRRRSVSSGRSRSRSRSYERKRHRHRRR